MRTVAFKLEITAGQKDCLFLKITNKESVERMTGDISIPISTESGFRYKVNQFACLALCTYMTLPYSRRFINSYALIAMVGLWFITTDFKWLSTRLSKDLIFVMFFFTSFVPYALTGTLDYGRHGVNIVLFVFPLFFTGMFINHYYMYYKKDFNTLGKIALVSVVMYAVGSIQTYLGLLRFPGASRGLAGATFIENPSLVAVYRQLGIGGFGYINAACLIIIAVAYPLIRKNEKWSGIYKAVAIVALLAMVIMILKASYATAILLIIVGLILAMVVKSRRTFIAIMVITAAVLLFFPQQPIGELLLKFAGLFSENRTLYPRFTRVAMMFFDDVGTGSALSRLSLYKSSVFTFLNHPLFGVYGPFGGGGELNPNSYSVIGGHSGWLDLLGFYGLFAGVPLFFAIYYNIKKHLRFFADEIFYGSILVTSFLFVIMGFLNPSLTVVEIGFAQFCIVPAIPFLSYAFVSNEQVLKRSEPLE